MGRDGHLTGYEIRDDFARRARTNVEGFLGADVPLDIHVRDVYEGIDAADPATGAPGGFDRILLDLPEPWRVVKHAEEALHPGGIMLAFTSRPSDRWRACGRTSPAPRSGWSSRSRCCSARGTSTASRCGPTTGWLAHTGFLTHARLLAPRP